MEKFLSIPVTGEGNQLVPVTDVKLIEDLSTATTGIYYGEGILITLTHGTVSGTVFRNWLQGEMVKALQTDWTRASYSAIPNPAYAVSEIRLT
tara:strand:- start:1261 stop:1539 length:279 start_codon:yes stop_codon:yes gene_type:complete